MAKLTKKIVELYGGPRDGLRCFIPVSAEAVEIPVAAGSVLTRVVYTDRGRRSRAGLIMFETTTEES